MSEEAKTEEAKQEAEKEPLFTVENVVAALARGGGDLAKLFESMLGTPTSVPEEVFAVLAEKVGRAPAKDPCPCGSGRPLKACCRPSFQMLERVRRAHRESDGKAEQPDVEWLVKVGVDGRRGTVAVRPLDPNKPVPPQVAVDLLLKAWTEMFMRVTIITSQNKAIEVIQRMSSGRMPPMR